MSGRQRQGPHPDPLDPDQPRPKPLDWTKRWRQAYASQEMQAYRDGLRLGNLDVRASVLDDLSAHFGLSPEECVEGCINWERWSVAEWQASTSLDDFYRTTQSWAFDLCWYAYLQSEGYYYPVPVVIARSLPPRIPGRIYRHLDYGSGIGDTAQLFLRLGFHSTLADISPPLLDFARFRLERRGDQARYLDLNQGMPDFGAYDVITAVDTLFLAPDLAWVARGLHHALKLNGLLFANFDVRPATPENAWHLYQDDLPLYRTLQRAGFEPTLNLDRRLMCFQNVDTEGLAHRLRGLRDNVLLSGPLRRTYRNLRPVVSLTHARV